RHRLHRPARTRQGPARDTAGPSARRLPRALQRAIRPSPRGVVERAQGRSRERHGPMCGPSSLATPRSPAGGASSAGWRGFVARPLGMAIIRTAMRVALLVGWEWASGNIIPKFWISSPSAIVAILSRWIGDLSLFGHVA